MRASEFVHVSEGITDIAKNAASGVGNFLARQGFAGRQAQLAAYTARGDKDRETVGQALRDANYGKFIKDLPVAIDKAVNGGLIKPATAPAVGIDPVALEQFVSKYAKQLFKNYRLDAATQAAADATVNAFAKTYSQEYNSKKPVLGGQSLAKAKAIWDAYEAASKTSKYVNPDNAYGGYGGYSKSLPNPDHNVDLPFNANTGPKTGSFKYDAAKGFWEKISDAAGTPLPTPERVTNDNQIDALNRLAQSHSV